MTKLTISTIVNIHRPLDHSLIPFIEEKLMMQRANVIKIIEQSIWVFNINIKEASIYVFEYFTIKRNRL